jgi:tetratricopeptide (TPR) repeat protein
MQYFLAVLGALAVLCGQFFYGGLFRPAFVFPSYFILACAAVISGILLFFGKRERVSGNCIVFTVLLFFWLAGKAVFAPSMPQAQGFLLLILGCLTIYLLLAYAITRPEARLLFLAVLMVGGLIQSVAAAGQFFGVFGGQPQGWISEQLRLWYSRGDAPKIYSRAHGFYINGNHLSWFLNATGLFGLTVGALKRGGAISKVLWIYVGAVCLAASVATLSRGGMIAMISGIFVIFVLSILTVRFATPGRRLASLAVLICAFVIPFGVIFLILNDNIMVQTRMNIIFDDVYRFQLWQVTSREFQLQPLSGAGPGAFAFLARQFRPDEVPHDDYFAHNDWLQLAADFGYPAVTLGILAIIVHLSNGWIEYGRILRGRIAANIPQSNSAAIVMGAMAATVALSIHSFFDFNLQLPANALFAASIVGILANPRPGSESRNGGRITENFSWYGGLVLLIGAGTWLLASLWGSRSEMDRLWAENELLRGRPEMAAQIARRASAASYSLKYIEGSAHLQTAEKATDSATRNRELIEGIQVLRAARDLAPNERSVHILLARSFLWAGNFKEAKASALEVIRLEPRQVDGYELYGSALEAEGNPLEARRIYQLGRALYGTEFITSRLRALEKVDQNP